MADYVAQVCLRPILTAFRIHSFRAQLVGSLSIMCCIYIRKWCEKIIQTRELFRDNNLLVNGPNTLGMCTALSFSIGKAPLLLWAIY